MTNFLILDLPMMTGRITERGQDQVLHMRDEVQDITEEDTETETINQDVSDQDQDPGPYLHVMTDSDQPEDDHVHLQT